MSPLHECYSLCTSHCLVCGVLTSTYRPLNLGISRYSLPDYKYSIKVLIKCTFLLVCGVLTFTYPPLNFGITHEIIVASLTYSIMKVAVVGGEPTLLGVCMCINVVYVCVPPGFFF